MGEWTDGYTDTQTNKHSHGNEWIGEGIPLRPGGQDQCIDNPDYIQEEGWIQGMAKCQDGTDVGTIHKSVLVKLC